MIFVQIIFSLISRARFKY